MILVRIYALLLTALYGVTLYAYGYRFFRRYGPSPRALRAMLVFTILAHLGLLVLFIRRFDQPLMAGSFQALSALALGLAFVYFLIEWLTGERNMGMWILAFPFVFQLASSFGVGAATDAPALPRTALLDFHIATALVGYCAFSLSAAFSLMYLLLYRELKKRHLGIVFERLPSLDALERMGYRSIHFGLGFLVLATAIGEALLFSLRATRVLADPKIVVALLSIAVYAAAIVLRRRFAIRGKRFALLSIAGFGLVLFSLFVVNQVLPGFHRF